MKHSELSASTLKDIEIKLVYGDNKGDFSLLYKTYQPIITNRAKDFLGTGDVEDMVHEIFMKIFIDFNSFINQLPKRSLNTWISRIARDYLVAYKNGLDKNIVETIPLYDKRTKDNSIDIEFRLINKDLNETLEKICEKVLTPREYKVLAYSLLNMSAKEISVKLNCSTVSIHSILSQCRGKIFKYVERKFPIAFNFKKSGYHSYLSGYSDYYGYNMLID